MRDLHRSLRLAARSLARRPLLTTVAALILALGIGVNSTLVALVDGLLFRPLPGLGAPDGLIWVSAAWRDRSRVGGLSYPDYLDYRAGAGRAVTGLAVYHATPLSLGGPSGLGTGGEPERVPGQVVSGDYFAVLGVRPALGRFFLSEEDGAPGAHPVVVLGHRLWQGRFGGAPGVVGREVLINGERFTVIGVAPEGFGGTELGAAARLWVPLAMAGTALPGARELLADRGASWLQAVGRLAPEATVGSARAALAAVAARLEQAYPDSHRDRLVRVEPLRGGLGPHQAGEVVTLAMLVTSVAGLLLLITCSNVANLLLARALARRRETGIRLALGAGRGRLVRDVLAESALLALLGGGLGLLLATWTTDLLVALLPPESFEGLAPGAAPAVLGFTFGIVVLAAVICGVAPTLAATRTELLHALKDGEAGGGRPSRTQRAFVVAQLALSLVLLLAAGLFLGRLRQAATAELGFDAGRVAASSFDLGLQGYGADERAALRRQLRERVEALPGVESASIATLLPLSGVMVGAAVTVDVPGGEAEEAGIAYLNSVDPAYFRTLGIPLLAGRDLTAADGRQGPGVVIVSATAARRFWPGEDPLGRRLSLDGPGGPFLEVVGVAADGRYDEATEKTPPFLYLPLAQTAFLSRTALVARTALDPAALLPALRQEIQRLDPNLPVFDATTLAGVVAQRLDKERGLGSLLTALGALGLALAAIGLYGVSAQLVAHRRREIGLRIALGADRGSVLGLLVRDGLRLALVGVAAGSVLSLPLLVLLGGVLHGIAPADAAAALAPILLLTAVAAGATWLSARRAAGLDPAAVLRSE